ncbi:hypothetical protein BSKO_14100 [Bryopsis sp. KO-2023]|nr:hypothetical protein BSKO_14100 [Bryopsis sp. KO-2023]
MAFLIPRKRFGSAGEPPAAAADQREGMAAGFDFSTPYKRITLEDARNALDDVLALVTNPEVKARLDQVKERGGQDPKNVVFTVMPILVEVFSKVIELYEFPPGQSGTIQFMLAVREHSREISIRRRVSKIADCFVAANMMHMAEAMLGGIGSATHQG